MKDNANRDEITTDLATDREFNGSASHEQTQSIETSTETIVPPTAPPHLTPEAAVVLARIIQALTRSTRHHRAA